MRPMRELRFDRAAYAANLRAIAERVAPAEVMAIVKADAYGHGAIVAAQTAIEAGIRRLGVADLDEALALREAGVRVPVLAWLLGDEVDVAAAVAADIELGVSSLAQLERIAAVGGAAVHLKLDTGLSRNGVAPADWQRVFARAAELERTGIVRIVGVFSHLSGTSAEDDLVQGSRFNVGVEALAAAGVHPPIRHLAASAAAITQPALRYDLVRIGIAGYGLTPDAALDLGGLVLRPASELSAEVVNVKRVPAGAGVSYGFRYRTPRETTLALVPLGYADGVPRAASGRAEVAIGGQRYPVAGTIAMDQLVVDVGDAAVAVGERAVLWGDPATGAPSAEDWAEWAGTIDYEIVTGVGPRPVRTVVGTVVGEV